jgi:hypothetical protein
VDGPHVLLAITWSDRAKSRHIGSLGGDRRLSGVVTGIASPSSQANWRTTRTF